MFTLIIYIYAGILARGDSVAINSIDGFTSQQSCIAAAQQAESFVKGSAKEFRYVCVKK